MAAQTEEWSNSLIRLTALASRLEGEGYYNIAKLARAAADSLCRQAARQVTLPADHDRLAEEIESLSVTLSRLGVGNSLIQALERGRQALCEGRLPMVDETPNPFVCRTCGHMVVGQPGYQCPGCGAPGATLQEFPPVYWLNALLPQAALEKLHQTPMDVANIVESREESMSNPSVNLLGNAVKFSPDGGRIDLRVQRETVRAGDPVAPPIPPSDPRAWIPTEAGDEIGEVIRIDVRDQGPGMGAELQAQLFEKFTQGAGAARRGGLGLGLYLCRELVRRHGGSIWVESALGKGAVFSVRLPVAL